MMLIAVLLVPNISASIRLEKVIKGRHADFICASAHRFTTSCVSAVSAAATLPFGLWI